VVAQSRAIRCEAVVNRYRPRLPLTLLVHPHRATMGICLSEPHRPTDASHLSQREEPLVEFGRTPSDPEPCNLVPACPICEGAMRLAYKMRHESVCICIECETTLSVPHPAMKRFRDRQQST
jgi:hypothetical protein